MLKPMRELTQSELSVLYNNITTCRDKHQNGWLKEGGDTFYRVNGLNPCKCESRDILPS